MVGCASGSPVRCNYWPCNWELAADDASGARSIVNRRVEWGSM
jgi:hypothetical protein